MSSWVVPAEDKRKHKAMYNVDEFRSIGVLDASLVRGARHTHVLAGYPKLDVSDNPIVLYSGTQEQCDELFIKLMDYIHNEVKIIHLLNDINNPPEYIDKELIA